MEQRFEGKVAVVTGGARGLGQAITLRLAREGAAVVVVSLHDCTAQDAADEVERTGGKAHPVVANVAEEDDTRFYVEETLRVFGRLDILVNNAGTVGLCPVVDLPVDEWDRILAVNLRGTFLGCREAARQMIKQGEGGRILNCSSAAGRRGNELGSAYIASKFGVIGLTQTLAVELAPFGITVNAYLPGHVTSTPMWDWLDQEYGRIQNTPPGATKEAVAQAVPLARSGEPEEIAAVVSFLASDEASYITGESLLVDGGLIRF